ncbi:MAG TPA: ABC transporter permease [Symbiobacteriaceae bacterium]
MELSRDLFVRESEATAAREAITRPSLTYWQDAWRRLKQNKVAMVGLVVLILIALASIVAPMLSPYTYRSQVLAEVTQPPSFGGVHPHWFGTDDLGRDLWTRVWYGGRISLFIGLTAAFLNLIIGALFGGVAGYFGGRVDDMMMRIVEIISGLPELIMLILLMLIFEPGLRTIIIVMTVFGWVGMARLVRGQVLQLKEQEFVLAARTLGASPMRIIIKHLLPNAMGPVLVSLTMAIPGAIFFEATLSFLGMGVKAPIASWGVLASDGRNYLLIYPYMLIFPALAIAITMLAFNLLGDGLRDALDPRLRGKD